MSHAAFDERLTRITQRHRRMASGVSYRIGPDGLMVPVPRRGTRRHAPLRVLLMLVAMAYVCKLLLFVALGEGVYVSRLDLLRDSLPVGEVAMPLLGPDPVMRSAAGLLSAAEGGWLRLP